MGTPAWLLVSASWLPEAVLEASSAHMDLVGVGGAGLVSVLEGREGSFWKEGMSLFPAFIFAPFPVPWAVGATLHSWKCL